MLSIVKSSKSESNNNYLVESMRKTWDRWKFTVLQLWFLVKFYKKEGKKGGLKDGRISEEAWGRE